MPRPRSFKDCCLRRSDYTSTQGALAAFRSLSQSEKNRRLLKAADEGQHIRLGLLLQAGADVDARDNLKRTALHTAVEGEARSCLDCVQKLVDAGADLNCQGPARCTPLHQALKLAKVDIVKLLLSSGASDRLWIKIEDHADDSRKTGVTAPETRWAPRTALCFIASRRVPPQLVNLVFEYTSHCNESDGYGRTPLMLACRTGNLTLVKMLLEKGVNIHTKSSAGATAFLYACESGDDCKEVIQLLLSHGAEIDQVNKYGIGGLNYSARRRSLKVFIFLLQSGASVRGSPNHIHPPLVCAARGGNCDIIKLALTQGADIEGRNTDGQTPLFAAFLHGKLEAARLLVQLGANVEVVDNFGKTPLKLAVDQSDKRYLALLATKGVHP